MSSCLITGITGQDGYWLAAQLLEAGHAVTGVRRRTSSPLPDRLGALTDAGLTVAEGDVTDAGSIHRLIETYEPDEFYHLAAQSHVGVSWSYPTATADVTGLGTLRCLEALRDSTRRYRCRFYFAGSSEQFGNTGGPLDEDSPMVPESPYAAAKVFGYNIARVYRHSHDMHVSCGILFNHESEERGLEFVTRKITHALATERKVSLGNMEARRDWGYAPDYTQGMQAILRHDEPDDFVLATGESHSVREFYELACARLGLDPAECVETDPAMQRPADVYDLVGDSSKARGVLAWEPSTSFESLVCKMAEADRELATRA